MGNDIQFVAFHGWAFDGQFWRSWKNELENYGDFQIYDRGYFGNPSYPDWKNGSRSTVLLTHSFGLHFLDKSMLERADMLAIMAGFLNFHPHAAQYRRRSRLIMQEMINKLEAEPENVLQEFYKNCFAPRSEPDLSFSDANVKLLLKDLKLLKNSEFNVEMLKKVNKVCILHGSDDKIVSYKKGRQIHNLLPDISKYFEIKDAGHALPYTHDKQCREFLIPEIERYTQND